MEEAAEGLLKIAARLILAGARFLIWVAWEFMCETVFWYIGWPIVRSITVGRLPGQFITNGEKEKPAVHLITVITGLSFLLIMMFYLVKYLE